METLVKINKVKNMDHVEALRKLYNDVENCVRNLKSLKIETSTYGNLLIPLLKEKIPDELNMIISHKFSGSFWTLDLMLKYFNEELQAKEICAPFKKDSEKDKQRFKDGKYYTGSSLYAESDTKNQNKCVYCLDYHTPSQCKKVTNRQSRIEILKRFSKCFLCLKSGHVLKNCPSKYICKKCNGRHHISICETLEKDDENNDTVPRGVTRVGGSTGAIDPPFCLKFPYFALFSQIIKLN